MLGGNGYLLWSGVAGVVTGALTWLLPLSWEWQGTLFAVLTLLAAWLWSRWLRKRVKRSVRPTLSSTSAGSSWSAAVLRWMPRW
jgi:membrane protein implicated in regulation of membrane protease activity